MITITATVDRADGTREHDALLQVTRAVRLGCGCTRYECELAGGGQVHILRGQHCQQQAIPA